MDAGADVGERLLDDPVAGGRAGDLERLDDVDARRDSVESVREKRAIVTLRTTLPIFIGRLSLIRSQTWRPLLGLLQLADPEAGRDQRREDDVVLAAEEVEAFTTYWVSVGRSPPRSAKIFTKTGTRNISIPIRTSVANTSTIVG